MQLIAREDIVLSICDLDVTVARKDEALTVVSTGFGFYEVVVTSDVRGESFIVQENQVTLA